MANVKISALSALGTTPAGGDVLPITDVSGTPTTKKVTVTNLMGAAPIQTVAGRTGAVTIANTDVSGLGTAAVLNVGTADTNVVQLADVSGTVKLPAVDGSQLLNLPSPDVNTPLTTALRGTDNPHIGAYPNQSFKVVDNPFKSVMIVADEAGNLKLLNSLGVNNIAVGFSVVEDGTEPDIEVVSGSETYSVISGDSDSKGANGLPTRQGFNLPDIGANPAPILISGGLIA